MTRFFELDVLPERHMRRVRIARVEVGSGDEHAGGGVIVVQAVQRLHAQGRVPLLGRVRSTPRVVLIAQARSVRRTQHLGLALAHGGFPRTHLRVRCVVLMELDVVIPAQFTLALLGRFRVRQFTHVGTTSSVTQCVPSFPTLSMTHHRARLASKRPLPSGPTARIRSIPDRPDPQDSNPPTWTYLMHLWCVGLS